MDIGGQENPIRKTIEGLGNNAVQTVTLDQDQVEEVCVFLEGSGAITDISFCMAPSASESPSTTPTDLEVLL